MYKSQAVMKIAVTSSNGRNIDTEFVKADKVYVFSKEGDRIQFLEQRHTNNKSNTQILV